MQSLGSGWRLYSGMANWCILSFGELLTGGDDVKQSSKELYQFQSTGRVIVKVVPLSISLEGVLNYVDVRGAGHTADR